MQGDTSTCMLIKLAPVGRTAPVLRQNPQFGAGVQPPLSDHLPVAAAAAITIVRLPLSVLLPFCLCSPRTHVPHFKDVIVQRPEVDQHALSSTC